MEKYNNPSEREFYIKMTKRYGWMKDVLVNNIENQALYIVECCVTGSD